MWSRSKQPVQLIRGTETRFFMNNESLRNLIEQKGLKLKFLAQQLGIRYETLYFKLKGQKEFSQSEIKKLCKLLDIPNREIFNFF